MLEHEEHFDDHFIVERGRQLGRVPRVMEKASKVTAGQRNTLTEETELWLRHQWAEKVAPRTGVGSYQDMARAITALSEAK